MDRLIVCSLRRCYLPRASIQVIRRYVQSDQGPVSERATSQPISERATSQPISERAAPRATYSMAYDDYIQGKILETAQTSFIRRIFTRSRQPCNLLDNNMKRLLGTAGSQLYYDCANGYPYLTLIEKFDLPDYISSWYKLTLLHVWLCLMRLHLAFGAAAYQQLQYSVLSALWFDVDKRLEVIGTEFNQRFNTKADMKKMHGLYLQTLFEYDEGFLDSDCMLASAIWRNLYIGRAVDPAILNDVVNYVRATVAFLDTLDSDSLVVTGIKKWEPAEHLVNSV